MVARLAVLSPANMTAKYMAQMLMAGLLALLVGCGRANPTEAEFVGRWADGSAELELNSDLTFTCAKWPEGEVEGSQVGGSGTWSFQDYDGYRVLLSFKELAGDPSEYSIYFTPVQRGSDRSLECESASGPFRLWKQ